MAAVAIVGFVVRLGIRLGVGIGIGASFLGCRRADRAAFNDTWLPTASDAGNADPSGADASPSSASSASSTLRGSLPVVVTDWCVAALIGLDEETCYFVPATNPSRALVLYLPGIVPPVPESTQKTNVETLVHDVALARGFTALLPRGRRGIGPANARDWYAWPTSARDYDAYAPAMIARWLAAKQVLESALGRPFERMYIAGSSSGAWFVVSLALRGALQADGWASISGGSPGAWRSEDLRGRSPAPVYIGYGAQDPSVATGAHALAQLLRAANWPLEEKTHPFGHGAHAVYLEEAFDLWTR